MEEQENNETLVRRAAQQGARSVTTRRQLVEDVVVFTIERWENAQLRGRTVANWRAWAFRVAANAAKRLASERRPESLQATIALVHEASAAHAERAHQTGTGGRSIRRLLRAHLAQKKKLLRGRQLEVLLKMAEPNMSFHRAAKELAMNRSNLSRTFKSAMRRLLTVHK